MSYNTALVENMVEQGLTANREANDALYPQVAAGDRAAVERMIESNMSLVIDKVDRYVNCYPGVKHLYDDLISEGFVGLVTAVNKMATDGVHENPNPTGYMSYYINLKVGAAADKELGSGVTDRTVRRHREAGDEMAHAVPMPDTLPDAMAVDPMSMVDLRDLIDACCETEIDRAIVRLRERAHHEGGDSTDPVSEHPGMVDKEIAAVLGLPVTTTYMLRRAIYARFLEKSGMKGEV